MHNRHFAGSLKDDLFLEPDRKNTRISGIMTWVDGVGHVPLEESKTYAPHTAPAVSSSQVGGDHYKRHKIQPWDVIDEYALTYYEGNVLKYLLRRKDPAKREEDYRKAIHYLEKCIERLKHG